MTNGYELLSHLPKIMRYARASEASTLFINESVAKKPPYLKFTIVNNTIGLEDFDGQKLRRYKVTKIRKNNKELTLTLREEKTSGTEEAYYVIYPYWDIDNAYVVIQKMPGQEENPVKWAIDKKYENQIEVFPEGYP